jgi:hypothetical protein
MSGPFFVLQIVPRGAITHFFVVSEPHLIRSQKPEELVRGTVILFKIKIFCALIYHNFLIIKNSDDVNLY